MKVNIIIEVIINKHSLFHYDDIHKYMYYIFKYKKSNVAHQP